MTVEGNKAWCDRCGADIDNANIALCIIVSDLEPDTNFVRNLHFCRDEKDEDGKVVRKGCASVLLSARNLEHYNAQKDEAESA